MHARQGEQQPGQERQEDCGLGPYPGPPPATSVHLERHGQEAEVGDDEDQSSQIERVEPGQCGENVERRHTPCGGPAPGIVWVSEVTP